MTGLANMEAAVEALLTIFDIDSPPVPIESMLQNPRGNMWRDVDVTQLSGSFLKMDDIYSPRMSMARLLARHIAHSEWGQQHGLGDVSGDEESLRTFARILAMPRSMIENVSGPSRTAPTMRLHFEVPEEDARLRLIDLGNG